MTYNLQEIKKDLQEYKNLKDEMANQLFLARKSIIDGNKPIAFYDNREFELYKNLENNPLRSKIQDYCQNTASDSTFELDFRKIWLKVFFEINL